MKALVVTALVVACLCVSARHALADQPRRPLAGRLLSDALRDFQARGLRIVFSTELVRPGMRVAEEPRRERDRDALDEVLRPHALEVQPGPGGTLLVVRARRAAQATGPATSAQATVRGLIVDARTATPLPGVLVRLANPPSAETVSESDGRFELTGVPRARQMLLVSLVGYTLARPIVDTTAGTVEEITVALTGGTATYSEQITVTADPFRAEAGNVPAAMVVNSADMLELRGVLSDDPLRAVQALPGVTSGNDFRSEFSVRGNDYRHMGLSVEGTSTGWPVHTVYGDAGGGSVTLINADIVDHAALFSGGYPQDRPGRTGAWLDVSLREGSRTRMQVRGALSMTSASLTFEGPLGGPVARGSWLVATRQSYVQWILKRMGSDTTAFGFTDVQAKFVYDLTPTQSIDMTVLGGRSQLDLDRIDDDPNLVGHGEADAFLVTAGWRRTSGGALALTQRASVSRYGFGNDRVDGLTLGDGTGRSLAYRAAAHWAARPSTMLVAGVHAQYDDATQFMTRFIERPPQPPVPRPQQLDAERALWSADLRVSHASAAGAAIDGGTLVSGATNDSGGVTPSPWLTATVPLGRGLSMRGAAGIYRQHPALDQTDSTFGSDGVHAERATQLDVGLEYRFQPEWRVQVTAYARREHDMLRLERDEYRVAGGTLVYPSLAPFWANAVEGSSSGIDVLAQRRSSTGLSGWVSYGYSRTRHDDRLTGERFDADFDERHTFSAYAQYRVSRVTSLSAKLRIGSSYPIPGYVEQRGADLFVGTARNTVRLPSYARLDVRANRAFNFDKRRLTLFAEIVNLLGRTNLAPGYDGARVGADGRVTGATQKLFPFLPAVGILVEF